jgi:diaminohydroxyphosphoribosylaminopyrimidine deaminase/5-amino-6-(5-phosphoribosylamino)uracil reductase
MTDEEALQMALQQAFEGYGFTSPNPAVGCVILNSKNEFVSMGYHHRAGEGHAEVLALAGVHSPAELRGARVFVTLEPCAHEGRTPACAKTLAATEVAEVIAILRDPNPLVSGKGFEILKNAGKKVRCLEAEGSAFEPLVETARAICEFFLVNFTQKRPFVSLKVATSLDGMMGLRNGQSQWLTSEASRHFARFLRGAHDACLVGKQTVLKDNPKLDARDTPFAGLSRHVVVLDSKAEILGRPDLQLFKTHSPQNIWIIAGPEASQKSSSLAQVIVVDEQKSSSEYLRKGLAALWDKQIRSVWIEGGAQTLSSALAAGIGDRLWLFQGPHLLGARHGKSWTESWGSENMKDRQTLAAVRHLALGPDHLTTGRMTTSKT